MEDLVTVRGIVLKHSPSGDYDWVVTIFTADRGKITAFARGARKPGNKLCGTVEPFCFGTFKLFASRSAYNIMEADIENYFEGLEVTWKERAMERSIWRWLPIIQERTMRMWIS